MKYFLSNIQEIFYLPNSDVPPGSLLPIVPSAEEVAEDVRGGGAGGCPLSPRMSRSEDWTSLA